MMHAMTVRSLRLIRCCRVIAAACFLTSCWTASVFAQAKNGCQDVGYARGPSSQYSVENLQRRLQRDPADVDALIHLGSHLEEQGQIAQAYALYERAIKAKPDCYLGYYFSGLAEERVSENASSDAEVKIRKAISLDVSLQNDPNMQGFLKRHARSIADRPATQAEPPSTVSDLFAFSNRFLIGVGVGLLLATPFFYFARRRHMMPNRA